MRKLPNHTSGQRQERGEESRAMLVDLDPGTGGGAVFLTLDLRGQPRLTQPCTRMRISPQSWNWLFLTNVSQQQPLMFTLAVVVSCASPVPYNLTGLSSKDRRLGNGVQHLFFCLHGDQCHDDGILFWLAGHFAIGWESLKKRFSFFSFFTFAAQCPANGKTLGRPSFFHSFHKHRLTFTGLNRGWRWRLYEREKWLEGGSRKVMCIFFFVTESGKFSIEDLGNAKKNVHLKWHLGGRI